MSDLPRLKAPDPWPASRDAPLVIAVVVIAAWLCGLVIGIAL